MKAFKIVLTTIVYILLVILITPFLLIELGDSLIYSFFDKIKDFFRKERKNN